MRYIAFSYDSIYKFEKMVKVRNMEYNPIQMCLFVGKSKKISMYFSC